MGAFGYGLFQDDCALDVRDAYKALLAQGVDEPEATRQMLTQWAESVDDPDGGPVFWLALALSQHALGRLDPDVQQRARAVLDGGLGLDRWKEAGPAALRKRQAALVRVAEALAAPQPPRKALKPPFRDACPWPVGTQVAFQLSSRRWVVLRVVAVEEHARGQAPVVELLEGAFETVPVAIEAPSVRAAALPPWSLAQWMARVGPDAHAPVLAMQRVLAAAGALDPVTADRWVLDGGPPIDWAAHYKRLERAVDRVKRAETEVVSALQAAAEAHTAGVTGPVRQFSLRRTDGASEMPRKRVRAIGSAPPEEGAVGDWFAVRWLEVDDFLADVHGLR